GAAAVVTVIGAALCEACIQQEVGSRFLTNLNAGGDTVPRVNYTVIATRFDEVVTPFTSAFLSGANVPHIIVNDGCPQDRTDPLNLSYDPRALDYMLNALDPAHPRTPRCVAVSQLPS